MAAALTEIFKERKVLNDIGVTFIAGSNDEDFLSYGELYQLSLKVLSFLQEKGVQPKDELVLQTEDNKIFIIVFWACILGGIIPIPLSLGQNDDHKLKLFNIWRVLKKPYLLTSKNHLHALSKYSRQKELGSIYTQLANNFIDVASILSYQSDGSIFEGNDDDIAFVQFSSGSTGNPKGVILTHRNLLINMQAISNASGYTDADSMMSWMPLTHDMGLIGFHLNPLVMGMDQCLIATNIFIRNPALWLDKASQHKITILCSPNFGYKYMLKHHNAFAHYNWNLSQVRILYNGAEPISEKLCHEFLDTYSKYGLQGRSMCPVYGLAEASLAVSISKLDEELLTVHLDRMKLAVGDKILLQNKTENSVAFVNVGKSIDHCSIRIADGGDHVVSSEIIGHIQIKGDNVTSGYYNNEHETKKARCADGWLKTGDLGFIKDDALYVTGRAKDIIFVNGQNYYPHDIERIAEEIEGIELNKIAVAGFFNIESQKEETIAFVFHRASIEKFIPIAKSLRVIINSKAGFGLDRIIPVKEIPKTTSGKLQRFRLLEQYKKGDFRNVEMELSRIIKSTKEDLLETKPKNSIEGKLLEIWKIVLNNQILGVTEKFFEIGGNSLKAAEMSMLLQKDFQIALPFEKLYENQTITELAKEIAAAARLDYVPIPIAPEKDYYHVSSSQKRIYYLWEIDKFSVAYNIPAAFQINHSIKPDRLEDCIRRLILRHSSLRMSFRMTSEPEFRINTSVDFSLELVECNPVNLHEMLKYLVRPFDLAHGPLFRIKLLKIDDNQYILFTDFHHIISDGISVHNFIHELFKLYNGNVLSPVSVQYEDFVFWENENRCSEKVKLQESYWLRRMEGELPVLEMPLDFQRPPIFINEGGKIEFEVGKELTESLKELAKKNGCTLHVLMVTIYTALLSKYTGQEEIIVGIPVTGRGHLDLQNVQGMFVNNLAIRSTINGDDSFTALLEMEGKNIFEALNNQEYSFEDLTRIIDVKRDISRNPIFDSMFIYQNIDLPRIENSNFSISRYFFDPGFSKFDISMEVFDDDHTINYGIEYSTRLFRKETIERFAAHFRHLMDQVVKTPHCKLSDLNLITTEEYDQYIREFNITKYSYPKDKTIHELFEEQVNRTPGNIAVEWKEEKITYELLNNKANQLAALLRERGVKKNGIIAILLPKSPALIVSILGVLKAGGCYLPMDSDLPAVRIREIIMNSQCNLVISNAIYNSHLLNLQGPNLRLSLIDIDRLEIFPATSRVINNVVCDHKLAYVIYTSGTMGKPKGVMISHQSLVNYISWAAINYIKKDEEATFPLFTSISFDLTVTSIFTPLITGNKIIIYEENGKDVLIERVLNDNKVQVLKLTPSHLKILIEHKYVNAFSERKLKRFIVGGEQLETRLAKKIYELFQGDIDIYNEYGPTEATVGCMIHQFNSGESTVSVPIGVPVHNTQVYVLDKFLKPLPIGIKGELYISGDGIARGYLFQEERTNQKFIPNPFVDGQKMYKTGDTVRRLASGILQYIGRSDQQVKINGYRVELSEIEHHLMSHSDISEACVTVVEDKKGAKNLYAYYKGDIDMQEAMLRDHLANKLPYYMIPLHFIRVEKIPLTKNGKVDYGELALLAGSEIKSNREPKNKIEKQLLDAWKEVLRNDNLCISDNFFELGGDSIKAVQIAALLINQGIVIGIKEILTYHTIEQISSHVETLDGYRKYEQAIIHGDKPFSPIEAWFFTQKFRNLSYYNQSVLLKLNRVVNIELLGRTFERLIWQHDGLRINYNSDRNILFYNSRHLQANFSIEEYEIKTSDVTGSLVSICQDIKSRLDIVNGLLMKAAIIRDGNGNELLFITAHHLIIDGVSWRIFLSDLYNFYNTFERGKVLTPFRKTASLIDWAKRLTQYGESENVKAEEKYWNEVNGLTFTIPQDYETDDWRFVNLKKCTRSLSSEKTKYLLMDSHRAYKTDVQILLNTALALALKKWTGFDKFVVEQESQGRHIDGIDISRTIGWFTAMYPLKLELPDDSLGNQIKAVKEQIRNIPYQGIGYGVSRYNNKSLDRWMERDITEIRFNYLGQFDKELNNELFSYSNLQHGSDVDLNNTITAKLELNSMIMDGKFILETSYNNQAHKESTVSQFLDSFMDNLVKVLEHIKNEKEVHFTPSDFSSVDLNQRELDALFS